MEQSHYITIEMTFSADSTSSFGLFVCSIYFSPQYKNIKRSHCSLTLHALPTMFSEVQYYSLGIIRTFS